MISKIRQSLLLKSFCLGLCLSLSGCIGSQILFEDDSPNAYGNLADVPEMMPSTPDQIAQQKQMRLQEDYEVMLKNHHDLFKR